MKDVGFFDTLRDRVDLLLNVHSLYILHDRIIKLPTIGSFNVHPGPLPRYAGLNAVSWAIYNGESQHGVTVHQMVSDIDAGNIAYQSLFSISENDTALGLAARCASEGADLVGHLLAAAAASPSEIPSAPQDLALRTYYGKEVPQDGRISWSLPAKDVHNFVRACDYYPFPSPWGHPQARRNGQSIAVLRTRRTYSPSSSPPGTVGAPGASGINIACQDEWLIVEHILLDGRRVRASELLVPGEQIGDG